MKKGGKTIDCVDQDVLLDSSNISISYQILGLRPADSNNDPTLKFDWRTYSIKERTITAPGRLRPHSTHQPRNIKFQITERSHFFIFWTVVCWTLVALAASIFESLG